MLPHAVGGRYEMLELIHDCGAAGRASELVVGEDTDDVFATFQEDWRPKGTATRAVEIFMPTVWHPSWLRERLILS